jgi:lysophospholipase L1-like esterase
MTSVPKMPAARLLRPARLVGFAEYVFRRNDKSGDIFPDDEPRGYIEGPNPERIVVFGEANAIGLGVTRHTLGMAGHLARLLAARTLGGVRWWAIGIRGQRIRNGVATVEENHKVLEQADLVVLMMGIVDTLSLTSRKTWVAEMSATLDALTRTLPRDATVLVTQIPPMDNAGSVSRLARYAAGRQARMFNTATTELVRTRRNCTMVPFPQSLQQDLWVPESREGPYVGMYSAWAAAAVSALSVSAA